MSHSIFFNVSHRLGIILNQTLALMNTLKRQLKVRGKTYLDVATYLDLSHASIKRLFSGESISLSRVESLCDFLDLSITDLVLLSDAEQTEIQHLTLAQEKELVSDIQLFLVSLCVINGYTFDDIIEQYDIPSNDLIQALAKLDRLKLIDLLPNNRIKSKGSANFNWLANGPIQKFFLQRVKEEFFQSSFSQTTEKLLAVNGLISLSGNAEIQKCMQKLVAEFVDIKKTDAEVDMAHKHGTTLVVAIRQWNLSLFKSIEKR